MSDAFWIALFSCLAQIITLYITLKVKKDVTATHRLINSRMTELLKTTAIASRAEGIIEGKGVKVIISSLDDSELK